jgi:hypothetical protein
MVDEIDEMNSYVQNKKQPVVNEVQDIGSVVPVKQNIKENKSAES